MFLHAGKQGSRSMKLFFAIIIILITLNGTALSSGIPLSEKFKNKNINDVSYETETSMEPYYHSVLKDYEKNGYESSKGQNIILEVNSGGEEESYEGIFTINDNSEGLYEIEFEYYPVPGKSDVISRRLIIDEKTPFYEANRIILPRKWRDKGEPRINNIGDEVAPGQEEIIDWHSYVLCDSQGFYSEAYKFYFAKGVHTIKLEYIEGGVSIGKIILKPAKTVPPYSEVKVSYEEKGYPHGKGIIQFEAESTVIEKSDPTIRRLTNSDPATSPQSLENIKLNIIGDYRWRKGAQSITWKFNVSQDGLYKIALRGGQWFNDRLPVYRKIEIDGAVLFKELEQYKIHYDRKWQTDFLKGEDGEDFLFYLCEGDHTITMTVVLGDFTEIIYEINDDAMLLSDILLKITMITGSEIDYNYEYELERSIPDLIEDLEKISENLKSKAERLEKIALKKSAISNSLLQIKDQVDDMIKRSDRIPNRLNDLINAQASLGTWYMSLQEQPLAIDYFVVCDPRTKKIANESNIFQKLYATWVNFIRSFYKDYDSVGNVYDLHEGDRDSDDKVILNVWVGMGKEWAEILKEMADEDFSPQSNILINLNVLPGTQLNAGAVNALMLSLTTGNSPDLVLGVGAGSPVEFAMRGAVVDLSEFSDYREIQSRFIPGILTPFKYQNGIYAIPETMNFRVIIYRKDIFGKLGLNIPDTWDEVYENLLPMLYQNNMQLFYGSDLSVFLFQHGGAFYNPDGTKSALDTPEAYRAFKEYVELYTSYGVPISASFYNRFRTGEMPIGIAGYPEYMTLSIAAPELAGKWAIALIPGHVNSKGIIDRSVGGIASTADIILKNTKYKDEAWEFLKWWSDAHVQERFGKELEALVGLEARWNTANKDAFLRIPWKKEDLEVIKEHWQWANDMPVVPGGYFTGRHLVNAWNRSVLGEMNVRDSLEQAVEDINKELLMKQEEQAKRFENKQTNNNQGGSK